MSKISAMVSVAIILYLAACGEAKSTDRDDTESIDFGQDIEVVKFKFVFLTSLD
jgi:hypothetical protein